MADNGSQQKQQQQQQQASPPPAPRGSSPTGSGPQRSSWRPRPGWILFFVGLLALNLFLTMRANEPASRVRVPYSPYFVSQVKDDNVKQITSKGTAIQGEFTKAQTFGKSKPTTKFKTEVPAFANTDELSKLLQDHNVTVNA
ncbi:MAG TPA: ATP-dependent metallopeptidase FtsH/Yme1/Tma family protein, partial [Gaiellaceae bacterium]|nr:ATP-dependent metallopeptidase FtsH/Yme1/Tma family protein [Gaiellaceae bacterium]